MHSVYGTNPSGQYVSFVTKNKGKTYSSIADPNQGTLGTVVHNINDNGDVHGTYYDTNSLVHATFRNGDTYYEFDDPNGVGYTRADGLNLDEEVVGRYTSSSNGATVGFSVQPNK